MQIIYSESISKIKKNKKLLEKELNVKLSFTGKNGVVEGNAVAEYLTIKIIEAMNLGFTAKEALLLKDEHFLFEIISIKDHTKRRDLERIRGRLIGTKGKTKNQLQELSNCFVSIHDSKIGIIGEIKDMEIARQAVISLIKGSKESQIFGFLEREKAKEKNLTSEQDLGLREKE